MFTGIFHHQLDAKGRTALPVRFRDVLSGQGTDKLIITSDLRDPFLQAYSPAQWETFARKVAALPQLREDVRRLMHVMIAPALECPFDKVGRILVPPQLREHAGLGEEVVWVGQLERIELWSPQAWKKKCEQDRTPESIASIDALANSL